MRIEMRRRPYASEKPERQKQEGCRPHERSGDGRKAKDRIHRCAKRCERQSHNEHSDVVKNAAKKDCPHGRAIPLLLRHYKVVSPHGFVTQTAEEGPWGVLTDATPGSVSDDRAASHTAHPV